MPARSRRQQKYLYAKFGEDWVKKHHFDNKLKDDKKSKKHKKKK